MGSRFHVLAQVIVGLACVRIAAAETAADLIKNAGEEYKTGNYDAAAALLQRAYELEPKSDTLFALAQAERLGGRCPAAIPHYKKLLSELKDLDVAKLVQSNLSLCVKDEPVLDPKPTPPIQTPAAPPKVVVRVERKSDKLAVAMFATGTLSIGAAIGFYVASRDNRDAALDARTIEDNRRFNDRADLQTGVALVAGTVGLGLASYAVVRWMKGGESSNTVAVTATSNGGAIGYAGRW